MSSITTDQPRSFCCRNKPCWEATDDPYDTYFGPVYPLTENEDEVSAHLGVFTKGGLRVSCRCAAFRCTRCNAVVGWCRGADDNHPEWCDYCVAQHESDVE